MTIHPESAAAAHWWADQLAAHRGQDATWYTTEEIARFREALAEEIDRHVRQLHPGECGHFVWGAAEKLRVGPHREAPELVAAAAETVGITLTRWDLPPRESGLVVTAGMVVTFGRDLPRRVVYGPLIGWVRSQLDEDESKAEAARIELGMRVRVPSSEWGKPKPTSAEAGVWRARTAKALFRHADLRAEAACEVRGEELLVSHACGHHVARHDPARVLADVAGKRTVVDAYEKALEGVPGGAEDLLDAVPLEEMSGPLGAAHALRGAVQALACGWRHAPGFQPAWEESAG